MAITTTKIKIKSGGNIEDIALYESLDDVYGHGIKVVVGGRSLYACYSDDFNNSNMSKLRISAAGKTYGIAKVASKGLRVLTDKCYTMRDLYPDTYETMTYVPDNFDISQLTTMEDMFAGCAKLREIPKMDTRKIKSFSGFCKRCESLGSIFPWVINLSSTGQLSYNMVNIQGMFSKSGVAYVTLCGVSADYRDNPAVLSQKIWNDTSIRTGAYIVDGDTMAPVKTLKDGDMMSSLLPDTYATMTEVPYDIDVSQMTSLRGLFSSCIKLEKLPKIYGIDKIKPTDTNSMYLMCKKLRDVPNIDTSQATDVSQMYSGCESLTTVSVADVSKATSLRGMYDGCISLTSVQPVFDAPNATDVDGMFRACRALTGAAPQVKGDNITTAREMYCGCIGITSAPEINLGKTNSVSAMYGNCSALTQIPWVMDLHSVTGIRPFMIFGGSGVTEIKVKLPATTDASKITGASFGKTDLAVEIVSNAPVIDWGAIKQAAKTTGIVTIPDGATEIPPDTFSSMQIKKLIVPASVKKIGARAFYNCNWDGAPGVKTKELNQQYLIDINLPGVEVIDVDAFASPSNGGVGVSQITNDRTGAVTYFDYWYSHINYISMPMVKTINSSAFASQMINRIDIGDQIQLIDRYAFTGAQGIEHYVVSSNSYSYKSSIGISIKRKRDAISGVKWGARSADVFWIGYK